MKILIAEDDGTSRTILENVLTKWGYQVIAVKDGEDAWKKLQESDPAPLMVLDWMMPKMDGLELCRKVREAEKPGDQSFYIILLTGRNTKEDIVAGLQAGANDYITKPFDKDELKARVDVGRRVVELQSELSRNVKELKNALEHIKTLQGILPICSYCKKIRDDKNYWQQVETYIAQFTDARFSHSICPDCFEKHVKPQLKEMDTEEE